MKNYSGESHINLGTGREHSIRQLTEAIAKAAGWLGTFVYDSTKPGGMPRKAMDIGRLFALVWTAQTRFEEGIRAAYDWYVANKV